MKNNTAALRRSSNKIKKDMILRKTSALIQNKTFELNSTQRKIINACIYVAQQQKIEPDSPYFKTDIKTIKSLVGSKKHDKSNFAKLIQNLSTTRISFNYLEKDTDIVHWRSMAIFSDVDISEDGSVVFEFPNKIRESVLAPELYTPLNLTLIKKFKSSYAIILYEFLRDYLYVPKNAPENYIPVIPKLTIEQMRDLLGIKSDEYPYISDFKKRVLNPAIKEINIKASIDINCYYKLEKTEGEGNQYKYIQLYAKSQTKELLPDFSI